MVKPNKKKVKKIVIQKSVLKNNTRPPVRDTNNQETSNSYSIHIWLFKIICAIFILYLSYFLSKKLSKIIIDAIKKNSSERKRLIIQELSEVIFYVIFAIGVLIALLTLGVQTATILTVLGTLVVTVGLALQNTLSNIFSGVFVALADNFRIGDTIRVYVPNIHKGAPIEGIVIDMNMSYVKIIDQNTNREMYIPNASISGNVITNLSRNGNENSY